ncbi:MAG TPA: YggS family pyridoxal phosphate-dependent enzyme [Maribacter sp.]|uniref:YggS family pyridoxal phosphate-dependent enzyme n=1 Tax=unclassified Maribacter TaxID=2615042 RepID=UPI000ED6F1F8|nr:MULTISPECIES: YggS family pyridoxal phosphate-dependent enzyme [unclassified Maribacter]HAF76725.1 YggS family pyridoxal phosphate-dependent enzyme [Maribacter sp.]HAI36915.1 YggS family pyridoxal phosphate-dependent enzyme [Maribacter sp.]|tara:strand:+ start:125136 stop:125789 length:654 start_codon:yes stop_codon:yes gene_type:complete
MSIKENLLAVKQTIPNSVTLVAVSKTKPISDIQEAYDQGQRIFGENRVQEMTEKWEKMPKDIEWHMIGHLQRNKVKYMAEYVSLVHGVDSPRLLAEINKQAEKHNRTIPCLLQVHIAEEDTKFGFNEEELLDLVRNENFKSHKNAKIVGLMGMATFTENMDQVRREFKSLQSLYLKLKSEYADFTTLSMGMSGDYQIAIEEGSTMVRIGSSIFGSRN